MSFYLSSFGLESDVSFKFKVQVSLNTHDALVIVHCPLFIATPSL